MSKSRKELREERGSVEVLVAKYGLVGAIIAAIIGLIGVGANAYVGYLADTAPIRATQAAESATILPISASPPPKNSDSALPYSATPSSTPAEAGISERDISAEYFRFVEGEPCITTLWHAYPPTETAPLTGCYPGRGLSALLDWFYYEDGVLRILREDDVGLLTPDPSTNRNVLGAVYAPIPANAIVEFDLKIRSMQYSSLQFGVAPKDKEDLSAAILLLVVKLAQSGPTSLHIQSGSTITPVVVLPESEPYAKVRFVVENRAMSIFVDDNQIADTIFLPFEECSFWMGYSRHPETNTFVDISNIRFVQR